MSEPNIPNGDPGSPTVAWTRWPWRCPAVVYFSAENLVDSSHPSPDIWDQVVYCLFAWEYNEETVELKQTTKERVSFRKVYIMMFLNHFCFAAKHWGVLVSCSLLFFQEFNCFTIFWHFLVRVARHKTSRKISSRLRFQTSLPSGDKSAEKVLNLGLQITCSSSFCGDGHGFWQKWRNGSRSMPGHQKETTWIASRCTVTNPSLVWDGLASHKM